MQLSLDKIPKFVTGLERSVADLPKLCQEWKNLDDDLILNYQQQFQWMLNQIEPIMAVLPEGSHWHTRLYLANQKLESMRSMWEFIVR